MPREIWKAVPGYQGYYEISNLGIIRSLKHRWGERKVPKILKAGNHKKGYLYVNLCKDGSCKSQTLHKLVLGTFCCSRPVGMQCAHLNGNPKDNRLENLEWVSPKKNQAHRILHGTSNRGEASASAKLTTADVLEIRERYSRGSVSQQKLADTYGISRGSIKDVLNGKTWKHI